MIKLVRRIVDGGFAKISVALARSQVTANEVTLSGFIMAIWAFTMIAMERRYEALIFILLNRLADGIDGPLARLKGPTLFGKVLDPMCDAVFYLGCFAFFSHVFPQYTDAMVWMIAVFCLDFLSIELTRKVFDESLATPKWGELMNGTEIFFSLVLILMLPDATPLIALVYSVVACVAVVLRLTRLARLSKSEKML